MERPYAWLVAVLSCLESLPAAAASAVPWLRGVLASPPVGGASPAAGLPNTVGPSEPGDPAAAGAEAAGCGAVCSAPGCGCEACSGSGDAAAARAKVSDESSSCAYQYAPVKSGFGSGLHVSVQVAAMTQKVTGAS